MLRRPMVKGFLVAMVAVASLVQVALSRVATGFWVERLGATQVPRDIAPAMGPSIPRAALRFIGEAAIPRCIDALGSTDWRRRAGAADALRLYGAAATPATLALVDAIRGPFHDYRSPWNSPQTIIRRVAIGTLLQNDAGHEAARQYLTAAITREVAADTAPLVITDDFSNPARWNDRARRAWAAFALAQLDPGHPHALAILADDLVYEDVPFRAVRREKFEGPGAETSGAFAVRGGPGYYYNREIDVRGAALAALLNLSFTTAWRTPVDQAVRTRLLSGLVQHATETMSPSVDARNKRLSAMTVIRKMGPDARDAAVLLAPLLAGPDEAVVRDVRATLQVICPEWDGRSCP